MLRVSNVKFGLSEILIVFNYYYMLPPFRSQVIFLTIMLSLFFVVVVVLKYVITGVMPRISSSRKAAFVLKHVWVLRLSDHTPVTFFGSQC